MRQVRRLISLLAVGLLGAILTAPWVAQGLASLLIAGLLGATWVVPPPAYADIAPGRMIEAPDAPLSVQKIPLPPSSDNPQIKPTLSCFYYPHFMIRQLDSGEKGAALYILPYQGGNKPACQATALPNEKEIDDWLGYFDGMKGDYVIFSGDDAIIGGLGFGIYDGNSGKHLFEDIAVGKVKAEVQKDGILLHYQRANIDADCSLVTGGDACWQKIRAATGLNGAMPDCKAAYRKETDKTATSVISYAVETKVTLDDISIKPTGGPVKCWPHE